MIAFGVLVISAVTAVMQHFSLYGLPSAELLGTGRDNGRVMGLTQSAIQSGSQYMIATAILWGIATQLTLERMAGRYLLLLTGVVLLALYFTYTRSVRWTPLLRQHEG